LFQSPPLSKASPKHENNQNYTKSANHSCNHFVKDSPLEWPKWQGIEGKKLCNESLQLLTKKRCKNVWSKLNFYELGNP